MGSRDIRDVIKVTRLCKNYNDIEAIIKALSYYSEKFEQNNNEESKHNSQQQEYIYNLQTDYK